MEKCNYMKKQFYSWKIEQKLTKPTHAPISAFSRLAEPVMSAKKHVNIYIYTYEYKTPIGNKIYIRFLSMPDYLLYE